MFSQSYFDLISAKRGKALYAIACGERMTKLDVKERAGLSMSTVIAAVGSLRAAGLVTVAERRMPGGGKPHSVIDAATDKCVFGISYKAGKLYAAALDLGGRVLSRRTMTPSEGASAEVAITTLFSRLSESAPKPIAIGVALTYADRDSLVRALSEEYGASVTCLTNTQSVAYRAVWQGGNYPLAVIGIGRRVKCAFLDERCRRVADLSDLTLAPAFSSERGIASLLSAPCVERTLFDRSYGGHYLYDKGDFSECRDLSDYSRLLVQAIVGTVGAVQALSEPKEIRLFGDYITRGFFDRISEACPVPLLREEGDGEGFACGAAIAAMTECVFV